MKNNLPPLLVAAAIALAPVAAKASAIDLSFEGLQDLEPVEAFYDGGFGGDHSGPGPNDGVTFSANAFAEIESNAGGSGNFQGKSSPKTAVIFLSGGADVMDVDGGFTTGSSFFYSGPVHAGTINIWSGLDDTGTLLATLTVPMTPSEFGTPPCTVAQFCPFFPLGIPFSGAAHSVDFGGAADQFFFDDITLGANTLIPAPEPATLTLFGIGLMGVTWARRRRRR